MSGWQPIKTAPKDGTVVLVWQPNGVAVDDNVSTWPEGAVLCAVPARWHEPNQRTDDEAGWYPPWALVSFGVWDDPSTDFDQPLLEPTHWMPLPAAPL